MNLDAMDSKVLLDFQGAEICGDLEERIPPISLPNQSSDSALLAVDIGGPLGFAGTSFHLTGKLIDIVVDVVIGICQELWSNWFISRPMRRLRTTGWQLGVNSDS